MAYYKYKQTCVQCGTEFRGRADAKTCSARCRKAYSRSKSHIRRITVTDFGGHQKV